MYFFRKYKNRMMVALVTIILLIIIGVTNKDRLTISNPESFIGKALRPINKLSYTIGNKISKTFETSFSFLKTNKENQRLKLELLKLQEENRNLNNIIARSDFLRAELELFNNTKHQLIPAQVIGKEPGNWYDTFVIDKGSEDGILKGTTIIQGVQVDNETVYEGLLGRVVDVGPNTAKVASIIDESSKVAFYNTRTQDGGILSRSVDYTIDGYLYDSKADVLVGDQIYTSGLGKVFVKDLYIGQVTKVIEVEEEMTKKITVQPAINFKKIYKVYAILK